LNDQEVVVIANTDTQSDFDGFVIVDSILNPIGLQFDVLFSNKTAPIKPGLVKSTGPAQIQEVGGVVSGGPASVVPVTIAPMEIQILGMAGG
jgi:hypothetical protein